MFRTVDLVMIGLLLGGAAFTFKIKQDSEAAIEKVAELERQIRQEREALDVLRADWSLLADPKRVKQLVEKYQLQLQLEPLSPESIAEIDDIPSKPPIVIEAQPQNGIAGLIDGEEEITTGSVNGEDVQ